MRILTPGDNNRFHRLITRHLALPPDFPYKTAQALRQNDTKQNNHIIKK